MQAEILWSAILVPPLLVVAIIMLTIVIKADKAPSLLAMVTLNSKKSLAHQPLLWFSLCLPLTYFFSFGAIVWGQSSLDLSDKGFENFIKISTLPLLLLSLAVPFSLLIWRFHATLQTAEQIELASYKNNIDTYYAHKKALIDHFGGIPARTYEGGIKAVFALHPRLHLKFFKNTPPNEGIPDINTACFEEAINFLRTARHAIYVTLTTADDVERVQNYIVACDEVYQLGSLLVLEPIFGPLYEKSLKRKYPDCIKTSEDGRRAFTPLGDNSDELIGAYRYCRSFMRLLCEFAGYDIKFFERDGRYDFVDKGRHYLPKSKERRVEAILSVLEPYIYNSDAFVETPSVEQPTKA